MALYSSHTSVIRRSLGQNAIASAAYNSRSKLTLYTTDKETNITVPFVWDYRKKAGLAFSKIYAPDYAPEWVFNREKLWNKCEEIENRCDAQTSRKIRKALPTEFTKEQNIVLLEEFTKELVEKGMIVDVNIHDDTPDNPHVHFMLTMRKLTRNRYGEYEFSKLKNREWNRSEFVNWHRELWETLLNKYYKIHGFDITVSKDTYKEQGIDLQPGVHEGESRNISDSELVEVNRQIAADNAERIKEKPSIILDVIAVNQPAFTKEQIATELEKRLYAGIDFSKMDDIESIQGELFATFTGLYDQILVCPEISQLVEADLRGRTLYTTTKRLELEERFTANIKELHSRNNHVLNINDSDLEHLSWSEKIDAKLRDVKTGLIEKINYKTGLKLEKPRQGISLSREQKRAIVNVLNGSDISVLEGIPGAGKTTVMREVVRQYKKAGYKVIGVAPSSAASLELAKATGIECKNASLWRKEWLQEQGKKFELVLRGDYYKEDLYKDSVSSLTKKHVMIIDEASMGEMANMDYLISEARAVGAKVLKVGDSNQLSAVGWAGTLAKTISICGSETLSESRRQKKETHQQATKLLSQYRVRDALDIYWKEGLIKVARNESEANSMAVRSFVSSYIETACLIEKDDLISTRSKAIGVFENKTRDLLNSQVREQLKEAGILKGKEHRVLVGSTIREGKHEKQYLNLSKGEQIVFARNANRLGRSGIFNGELGTILKIHKPNNDALAKIDILVHRANGKKEKISLDLAELANNKYVGKYFHDGISIDYGYAVTSHKVQGASIDDFVMRPERGVGFEVFNVLSTRHKQNLEIIGDRETLQDAFYESLDASASKARNKFDLKLDNEETILKCGLAKMISKRSNTSFASDYRTMGQMESDKYIKQYIDKSEETIATIRKITSWQNIEQRRTGAKPEMWEHRDWQEFLERRKERSLAASTIIAGFAPNGKLAGDTREEYSHLTSAEFCKECLSASYAKFKDRIVQLGMNYATIEKHASQVTKYGELDKVTVDQKITILHEQDIFKELVQSVSSGKTVSIRNSCALVNVHIAETTLAIEEKNTAIAEIEDHRQELTDAIETEEHYRKILTPEYLSRIYCIDKGLKENKNAGELALKKYNTIALKHGAEKAVDMVIKNPTLLGRFKGFGVGRMFGLSNARKDAIELCRNLGRQLEAYNRSGEMIEQYKEQMQSADFGTKLYKLSEEIEYLRSLLPSDIDNEFLEEVGQKLKVRDSGNSNSRSNNIDWRDLQKSELFETVRVSQYSEKERSIFNHDDFVVERVLPKESPQLADNAVVAEKSVTETKTTSRKQNNLSNSKPILRFTEVKAALNQFVILDIFHKYAPLINSKDKIERLGTEIRIGSLHMCIQGNKAGLWKRFSEDSSKGDLFSFVETATGCSKHESLKIVASHAGIVKNCNPCTDAIQKNIVDKGATHWKMKANLNDKKELADVWVTQPIVVDNVPTFNPKKDLSFIAKKVGRVTLVHEYRNRDNQLLGYTIRMEDRDGRKQVLPLTYFHNEAKEKSRWQLKGFSDNGTKPIYGLEKLTQYPNKPILIVEGEKTADAASKLLPDYNVISWMGGAQAVDKVDWSKLAGRVVSIWPDNDKPGIMAANSIANHIDCSNGFSGLVSIVDTEKLGLPKKWDLADKLPKNIREENIEKIITNTENNSLRKQLVLNQSRIDKIYNKKIISGSLDILIAQGKICTDEYSSRKIYHASIIAIAETKNINLNENINAGDFLNNIRELQNEYHNLHAEYERSLYKEKIQDREKVQDIQRIKESQTADFTQEQLINELVRDISILQQVQLGVDKLTTTHRKHIAKAASAEVNKMQNFTDRNKEYDADNLYKTVTGEKWLKTLDKENQEKTEVVKERLQEQQLEAKRINNIITQIDKEKQQAKTPEEALKAVGKEQGVLSYFADMIKYPKQFDDSLIKSIHQAKQNEHENTIDHLCKLTIFLQEKNFTDNSLITKTIVNKNPIEAHKTLLGDYHKHCIRVVNKMLVELDNGNHPVLDNKKFTCPVKLMDHVFDTHGHQFFPHKEMHHIQNKIIEQQKQLEMSKDKDISGPHL